MHSATRSEISSPTFGAPGRGFGFRFLLVFLLSMMVQIVEHRAETLVDFLVEEEAASSMPHVPNRPVSGTAAVHATQQHIAAQTSRTPSRATPRALSVAKEKKLKTGDAVMIHCKFIQLRKCKITNVKRGRCSENQQMQKIIQ